MIQPTRTAGEEDCGCLAHLQEDQEQSGLFAPFTNQIAAVSMEDTTGHFPLDPLDPVDRSLGNSPRPSIQSTSRSPGLELPPTLEQYKAQFESPKRPFIGEDTYRSPSETRRSVHDEAAQPLDHARWKAMLALRSHPPPTVHDQQHMSGTYKPEQRMIRNQHVLGLKYINDRYGCPRRPTLRPNEPPKYIDNVFVYHDFTSVTTGPPLGSGRSEISILLFRMLQRRCFASSDMIGCVTTRWTRLTIARDNEKIL